MRERFLITCADERSWNTERAVVFLGEWCRRIDREQAWRGLDAVVARPVLFHGPDRERVISCVDTLSRELLAELAELLNRLHGIRRSQRYWRILLGHWLHRYTALLFHRWHAVQQVLEEHHVSGTIVFSGPAAQLAGHDTVALSWASHDDVWNNVLIGRILQELASIPVEQRILDQLHPIGRRSTFVTNEGSNGTAAYVTRVIDGALGMLQRETSSFVISSYLPRSQSILLSIRLGDVPRLRLSPPVQRVAVNTELRAANRLNPGAHKGFPTFARHMLLELLPTCYLEGFDTLRRQVDRMDWPSRPRLIFTSNSFDYNEVFKLWAAEKAEAGYPYIIGQHGGNYGTARYCPSETECIETADAFITWGWRGDNTKCRPAFIFRTSGRSRREWDRHGGLLLIEISLPHLILPWDPYPEFAAYQESQFRFVESLAGDVRKFLTVRLLHESEKLTWGEAERWRRRQPAVRLDNGTTRISDLISQSRLVVYSYDSTGILENLALNVPTIAFWMGGTSHLRANAVPIYTALADAGILHTTAESAAHKVTEVWADVQGWWRTGAVQNARKRFCHEYARTVDAPITTLAQLLLDIRSSARPPDVAEVNAPGAAR